MGDNLISATWSTVDSLLPPFFNNQHSFVPDVAIFVADACKAVEEGAIPTTKVLFLSLLLAHRRLSLFPQQSTFSSST